MSELPHPSTARGEATRRKLLEAAEAEIGENGFARSSVASITRRAGVGQGTFYLYFPSKSDALRELVRHMGHSLRRTLAEATVGQRDRLEIERRGLEAFLRFSLEHQNLYRVVMESQFVDEAIYREYYQTLADSYTANLRAAQERGEVGPGDPGAQAWALMGIAHFLGLRYAIWDKGEPPPAVMDTAFDFIRRGLGAVDEADTGDDAEATAAKKGLADRTPV
ncbi:MAG TPA: TetR/AcrR family transcriptional regulator [Trueperaceae bacterium]|nr:TetR/AcrR family transcriptional regulator [Trueperaceae bacterium]